MTVAGVSKVLINYIVLCQILLSFFLSVSDILLFMLFWPHSLGFIVLYLISLYIYIYICT